MKEITRSDYTEHGLHGTPHPDTQDERLSQSMSAMRIVYTLRTHRDISALPVEDKARDTGWPFWKSLEGLVAAMAVSVWKAELISSTLEATPGSLLLTSLSLGSYSSQSREMCNPIILSSHR